MIAIRRALVASVATLVLAGACTSISVPTIPPIGLPGASIPPINIPGLTIPPINIPGFSIPPGTAQCALITGAEIGQVMGGPYTDTSDSTTNCSFVATNFTSISVEATSDTDLTGIQFLLGSSAQQSTVGGFPALSGVVLGQPAVYVQKSTGQLQVLGILTGSDPATIAKLQQIATVAVGRMP